MICELQNQKKLLDGILNFVQASMIPIIAKFNNEKNAGVYFQKLVWKIEKPERFFLAGCKAVIKLNCEMIERWDEPRITTRIITVLVRRKGVDVDKRTATNAFLQLSIRYKIWPLYEQLFIFFLFYWPHLGLN